MAYHLPDTEAQKDPIDRLPRHVTIEESHGDTVQSDPEPLYHRTVSHQSIQVEARIPTEFRTLSIHVDTKTDVDPTSKDNARRGNNVKGMFYVVILSSLS